MHAALAHARLLVDIASIKLFVWLLGRDGELLDSHLFFYDRYSMLAEHHRRHGRRARADRLFAIAEAHFEAAPDDDDPPEAAMAMPVPRRWIRTNAVSTTRVKRPRAIRGLSSAH
jgi:hypothetical protein